MNQSICRNKILESMLMLVMLMLIFWWCTSRHYILITGTGGGRAIFLLLGLLSFGLIKIRNYLSQRSFRQVAGTVCGVVQAFVWYVMFNLTCTKCW